MKRLFVLAAVAALAVVAAPATAEELQGKSDFGTCTVAPQSINRVDRDAKRTRWVRVKILVHCADEYYSGKSIIRLAGVSPNGATQGNRDAVTVHLGRPVTAGDHLVRAKMRCNVKVKGDWAYPRTPLQVWTFTQVNQGGTRHYTTVADRTKSLRC